MTLSIEVPPALEATLNAISDLPERVQLFLQHQASLEVWREKRRNPGIARLRERVYEAARAMHDRQLSREVIGEQLLQAYDRLCQQQPAHE